MKTRDALIFLSAIVVVLIAVALFLSLLIPSAAFFGPSIAVIPLKTDIYDDTADEFISRLDSAVNDPLVDAIVIDISSGGGTVVATKRLVSKIEEARQEKPVVAYIGEIGASGAYYAAAASDYIFADDDSITGSIGAIWIFADINGLLSDFGIKMKEIKEGEFKSIGSMFHDMTQEEEEILQEITLGTFERFKVAIIELRGDKINMEYEDIIFDGRIFVGIQALEYGLIDETGFFDDAVDKAAELAGVEGEPKLIYYKDDEFYFTDLFELSGKAFAQGFLKASSGQGLYYK